MSRLEQRVEKLEVAQAGPEMPTFIISFIEPGTMSEAGRYRLGAGGGLVEVGEGGNDTAPGVSHEQT